MTESDRREVLARRIAMGRPWHSPPHRNSDHSDVYLITAACFEHRPLIGCSERRLHEFEESLCKFVEDRSQSVLAWVILLNHYHIVVRTSSVLALIRGLGRFHARTATRWNREDASPGRQVWCRCAETAMKSNRHLWATMHYVLTNPVRHGLVREWDDWPYSSIHQWLSSRTKEEVTWMRSQFPIDEYGKGWDD